MNATSMKRILAGVATSWLLRPLFAPAMRGQGVIYMLHRFRSGSAPADHHDVAFLEQCLASLRRSRTPVLSLRQATSALQRNGYFEGVVFTIDDGYEDIASVAAPVFREYECTPTVFVATGFIDGLYWFWWDRLEVALTRTAATALPLPASAGVTMPIRTAVERQRAHAAVITAVKALPQPRREAALVEVFASLGVALPDTPPAEYRPLTWDAIRELARTGIDFAPHTVSHPSVASLHADEVMAEVQASVQRLREERVDYVPVFAYPYGLESDVSKEAAAAVQRSGLEYAVTAIPGYTDAAAAATPQLLPRFAFPSNAVDFRQVVFGLEKTKEILAGRLRER